ncbi:MAG: histidine kinase [Pseudomonadota bacterium]
MADQALEQTDEQFFLPNFCETRSVFLVILTGEMLAVLLTLSKSTSPAQTWSNLGLISLMVQWVALTSTGALCLLRGYLARFSVVLAATLSLCIITLVTAIYTVGAQIFFYGERLVNFNLDEQMISKNLLIAVIVGFMCLRYFYMQQQYRARLKTESEARIQALQSRIHPHFLFNSMNIIASLTRTQPELAERVVEDLSELFRASLDKAGRLVNLEEEILLCKRYGNIEKLRLGERLQIQWRIEADTHRFQIPLLTIQPLLENAIYHGIEPLTDGGQINIVIEPQDKGVHITIANPYEKRRLNASSRGNQLALANIQERLQVLFGAKANFTHNLSDKIYVVSLFVPGEEVI